MRAFVVLDLVSSVLC